MRIAGRVLQSWLVDWPQQRSVARLQSAVRTQPEWQRKGTTGAFFLCVCVCLRRGFSSAEQRLELLEAECTNWAGSRIRVRRWVVRTQECLNMLLIRICDKWSHSGGAQSQRFLFCLFFYLTAGRDKFAVCDNTNACKRFLVPLYHVCWIKSTSLSYYLDATVGTARLSAYKTVRKVVLNGTIIRAVNCTGRAIRGGQCRSEI